MPDTSRDEANIAHHETEGADKDLVESTSGTNSWQGPTDWIKVHPGKLMAKFDIDHDAEKKREDDIEAEVAKEGKENLQFAAHFPAALNPATMNFVNSKPAAPEPAIHSDKDEPPPLPKWAT